MIRTGARFAGLILGLLFAAALPAEAQPTDQWSGDFPGMNRAQETGGGLRHPEGGSPVTTPPESGAAGTMHPEAGAPGLMHPEAGAPGTMGSPVG